MNNSKIIKIFGLVILVLISLKFIYKQNQNIENEYYAIIIDGEESNYIPEKNKYKVDVICNESKAMWDYNDWKLNIVNISPNTKCTLSFSSVSPVNLSKYIMSLDSNHNVVNEPTNDYRYIGNNPNNYVMFNNELWRIIGVFSDNTHGKTNEKLVKIIKSDYLATISWDKENINAWGISSLNTLLNDYYYNGINESQVINCIQNIPDVPGYCDFSSTGILDNNYRSMIEKVIWKYAGMAEMDSATVTYDNERNTSIDGNLYEQEDYIGLMYPSDYAFSVDPSDCPRTTKLKYYTTTGCSNTWLKGFGQEWTIISRTTDTYPVWHISNSNELRSNHAGSGYTVRPTLYLKSNTMKLAGNGSITEPYILIAS